MPTTHTIDLPGGSFSYLAEGPVDGRPVLCLHGFPDHPRSFVPLMRELAQAGYRVFAPWMRGYAPSTSAGPFHFERLAADVGELADALAPGRRYALVGHDWGAIAAYAAVAAAPPPRLACVVSLAIPHPRAVAANLRRHPEQLARSWYILFFQLPRIPEHVVAKEDFAFVTRLWRAWSPGYRIPPGDLAELKQCLAQSMPAPLAYYRAAFRLRPPPWARGRIATPLLHLHGALDGCVGAELGEGQERFFSGPFSSETVEAAGHFLQLERPVWIAQRTMWWLGRHFQAG